MYEIKQLGLGGYGVFHGAARLETFTFRADAEAYAERKNRLLSAAADEAEAVYTERRAMMHIVSDRELLPEAWSIRASIERPA